MVAFVKKILEPGRRAHSFSPQVNGNCKVTGANKCCVTYSQEILKNPKKKTIFMYFTLHQKLGLYLLGQVVVQDMLATNVSLLLQHPKLFSLSTTVLPPLLLAAVSQKKCEAL